MVCLSLLLIPVLGTSFVTVGCESRDSASYLLQRLEKPDKAAAGAERILGESQLEKNPRVVAFFKQSADLVRLGIPTLMGATYRSAKLRPDSPSTIPSEPFEPIWVYSNGYATINGVAAATPLKLGPVVPLPETPDRPEDRSFARRSKRDWIIGQFALVLQGREKDLDRLGLEKSDPDLIGAVVNSLREQVMYRRRDFDDVAAIANGELYLKVKKDLKAVNAEDTQDWLPRFVADIPRLIEDSRRRLAHPKPKTLDMASLAKLSTQDQIAKLIDHLDELNAFGVSNPGGVWAQMNPEVERLIEIGDTAVDPLLDCAQSDRRLTRFCWETGHAPDEPLLDYPVSSVALAAAADIVGMSNYQSVDEVRIYWSKIRKNSGWDRVVAILEDPSENPEHWVTAMEKICTQVGLNGRLSPMRGESLRSMSHPSLSEIVISRIRQAPGGFAAEELSKCLARWDPKSALPSLQLVCRTANPGMRVGSLFAWRMKLGDKSAAAEYLRWYRTEDRNSFFRSTEVEPFNAFPNDPILAKAAPAVFEKLMAHSGPERWPGPGSLMVPYVYEKVRQFLLDRSVIGKVTRDGATCTSKTGLSGVESIPVVRTSAVHIKLLPAYVDYVSPSPKDASWIEDGSTSDVLACDGIAKTLAMMRGRPFYYGWTRSERDQAVDEARKWLEVNRGMFEQAPFVFNSNFL